MTDETVDSGAKRVEIRLVVDEDVKTRYEREVVETYGMKRPYAGIVLERQLRAHVGDGALAGLVDAVADVANEFGSAPREKKFSNGDRGDTVLVRYTVHEDVRRALSAAASNTTDRPGEFVERVMHRYAVGRGVYQRAVDRLERVQQAADEDDNLSAKQRRTRAIANELADASGSFTIDEFDAAIESATNLGASRYNRHEYLPRVLERLEYTWLNETTFGDAQPEQPRDLTQQPKWLRDEDGLATAIKIVALRSVADTERVAGKLSVAEILEQLHGRPQSKVLEQLHRIDDHAGFAIDEDDGTTVLKVNETRANRDGQSDHAAAVVGLGDGQTAQTDPASQTAETDEKDGLHAGSTDETPTPEGGETTVQTAGDVADWVARTVELVHESKPPVEVFLQNDAVLTNKIARTKWGEKALKTDFDTGHAEPRDKYLDLVTDEHRQTVREQLRGTTPDGGRAVAMTDGGDRHE